MGKAKGNKQKQKNRNVKQLNSKVVPQRSIVKQVPPKVRRPQTNSGQGLLSAVGGLAGGYFGGPLGSVLGSSAGNLISRITGFGDYRVNRNSIAAGNSVPTFMMSGDGMHICHREFLADITGATAFTNLSLPINPGMPQTFPWLSQVAQNFEEYDFHGLVFEYRPSSGSAVSNTSAALGTVIYATDYNALSIPFATKQQMESYEYSCSTVPFTGMIHPVECDHNANVLNDMYIRNGNIPSGADIRLYDLGNFQYAVQGMQSAYTCGELWVSYDVLLSKPRIQPNSNYTFAHIVESPLASATAAAPLGTTGGVLTTDSNLFGVSVSLSAPTTSIIISIPGYYLLVDGWNGTGIAGTYSFASRGANIIDGPAIFEGFSTHAINSFTSTLSSGFNLIQVTAPGSSTANTITLTGPGSMASGHTDLVIIPMPLALF